MKKKIILFEGIPGSGKSTSARFLSIQLERNGLTPVLFHETTAAHPIIFLDSIHDENIWMEAYINRWNTFLSDDFNPNSIFVMESVLFQFPILTLLNKDIDRKIMKLLVVNLSSILRKHDVSLVYFYQDNSPTAINHMIESRGGDVFLDRKYNEYKNENYYINRGNKGPELHLAFLKEYADISQELSKEVYVNTVSIENSTRDWKSYEQQLLKLFKLSYHPDPLIGRDQLKRYNGKFRNNEMNFDVTVEFKEGNLYIFGDRKLRARKTDVFYLDDMSVEVTFIEKNGVYKQLIIGEKDLFGNRNEAGTAFERIS